jgi:hypothetical protein
VRVVSEPGWRAIDVWNSARAPPMAVIWVGRISTDVERRR